MNIPRKRRHGNASPAACLLPQIQEKLNRSRSRHRRARDYRDDDSPGKLYTYVSAGNIELPSDTSEREKVVRQSLGPVVILALVLIAVWIIF